MKKIILSLLVFLSCVSIAYNSIASAASNIKYTLSFKAGTQNMQYTVYQKDDKLKTVAPTATTYVNQSTNEAIIYIPQQNMAISQKLNAKNQPEIMNESMINQYKNSFTKAGARTINGYACTLYTNNAGIEFCYSETYGLAVYMKNQTSEMTISNISQGMLSDSDFQLPAGVVVKQMPSF